MSQRLATTLTDDGGNLFVGVLAKLGAGGVEEIIQLALTEDKRAQLQKSADSVRELVGVMGI